MLYCGGWGPWGRDKKLSRTHTLTGLASFRKREEESSRFAFDLTEFASNADVPRNALFHPNKCDAESKRLADLERIAGRTDKKFDAGAERLEAL